MARKQRTPDDFWREYEEKIGEKVIARSLGQYLSGWEEFDSAGISALWGLVIATSGGFRFHHFPQENWFSSLVQRQSSGEGPKEKTIFIPKEKITSAQLLGEKKWWKKIFSPSVPRLVIGYRDNGAERNLLFTAEYQPDGLAEALRN